VSWEEGGQVEESGRAAPAGTMGARTAGGRHPQGAKEPALRLPACTGLMLVYPASVLLVLEVCRCHNRRHTAETYPAGCARTTTSAQSPDGVWNPSCRIQTCRMPACSELWLCFEGWLYYRANSHARACRPASLVCLCLLLPRQAGSFRPM
jgi:hypothetical protein